MNVLNSLESKFIEVSDHILYFVLIRISFHRYLCLLSYSIKLFYRIQIKIFLDIWTNFTDKIALKFVETIVISSIIRKIDLYIVIRTAFAPVLFLEHIDNIQLKWYSTSEFPVSASWIDKGQFTFSIILVNS